MTFVEWFRVFVVFAVFAVSSELDSFAAGVEFPMADEIGPTGLPLTRDNFFLNLRDTSTRAEAEDVLNRTRLTPVPTRFSLEVLRSLPIRSLESISEPAAMHILQTYYGLDTERINLLSQSEALWSIRPRIPQMIYGGLWLGVVALAFFDPSMLSLAPFVGVGSLVFMNSKFQRADIRSSLAFKSTGVHVRSYDIDAVAALIVACINNHKRL